jgi:hypothetical protein
MMIALEDGDPLGVGDGVTVGRPVRVGEDVVLVLDAVAVGDTVVGEIVVGGVQRIVRVAAGPTPPIVVSV